MWYTFCYVRHSQRQLMISWLLGEADIALRDTFTGAETNAMYLADAGITPNFFLDKPESFYDRPALAEYIHELK